MQEFKNLLLCVLLSFPIYFAVQFAWKWFQGGFNSNAIHEWMLKGFCFGIGLSFSLIVVVLILGLVVGDK